MVEAGEAVTEAAVIQEAAGDASDHLAVTATVESGIVPSVLDGQHTGLLQSDPCLGLALGCQAELFLFFVFFLSHVAVKPLEIAGSLR